MERFRSILVVAGLGRMDIPTLQTAMSIASANDANLSLLNVSRPPSRWRRSESIPHPTTSRDIERMRNLMLSANLRDGVVIETRVGRPLLEILRYVHTNDCDLVIVGEPRLSGKEPRSISPGLMELVHTSPVPVWIIRPAHVGPSNVLAMVDLDSSDPNRLRLNDLAISLAGTAAGSPKRLILAHACDPATSGTIPVLSSDRLVDETRSAHLDQLIEIGRQHGVSKANCHLAIGDHDDLISPFIRKLDADLVVASVASQTHAGRFLTGDAVEKLLRTTSSSLLAVKLFHPTAAAPSP